MKLSQSGALDALCGEYLLGTLQGAARRRFERALEEEPLVALRLKHWQGTLPNPSRAIEIQPSPDVWRRLERELPLDRYRTPWHRRASFLRGWSVAATAVVVLGFGLLFVRPEGQSPVLSPIAQLQSESETTRVAASLSADRRVLELRAARPVLAGPAQSFELWVIAPGAAPVSIAVVGSLDARVDVRPAHRALLQPGAKLAVTAEPAGGAPTGRPSGAPILVGTITL